MTKEDVIREFNECVKENDCNLDRKYLDKIRLEIIDLSQINGWCNFTYKLYGFNYDEDAIDRSIGFSVDSKLSLGEYVYGEIVSGTDFMRKDKRVRELIDKSYEETIDLINRRNWYKFWNWFKPREKRNVYFGSCHMFWYEQKRILKEKYNIDWKTPSERNPGVYFD